MRVRFHDIVNDVTRMRHSANSINLSAKTILQTFETVMETLRKEPIETSQNNIHLMRT